MVLRAISVFLDARIGCPSRLTPEFSGRAPIYWDVHFIVHGRCNEMLGIDTYSLGRAK